MEPNGPIRFNLVPIVCSHNLFLNWWNSPLTVLFVLDLQLAVALQALKAIGLIHTDIKLENIMLVNQREQPLRVKLIDFGLAVPVSEAKQRRIKPNLAYR